MFEPGNKVRTEGCPGTNLIPGVYTVRDVVSDGAPGGYLYLEGIRGGWYCDRFELVKEAGGFVLSDIDV